MGLLESLSTSNTVQAQVHYTSCRCIGTFRSACRTPCIQQFIRETSIQGEITDPHGTCYEQKIERNITQIYTLFLLSLNVIGLGLLGSVFGYCTLKVTNVDFRLRWDVNTYENLFRKCFSISFSYSQYTGCILQEWHKCKRELYTYHINYLTPWITVIF
jgi:hypothetical protein